MFFCLIYLINISLIFSSETFIFRGHAWWHMSVIPAAPEVEIGRTAVQG
jgi:hypothetical protein